MRCVKCGEIVDGQKGGECLLMDLPPCCDECHDDVSEEVANGYSMWPSDWYGHWAWSKSHDCFIKHQIATVKLWH